MSDTPNPTPFHDDRDAYMAFAGRTDEKAQIGNMLVAEHVGPIVQRINGSGNPISVFDAGIGNGAVLSHVLTGMHDHCPTGTPILAVGKEISQVDVLATLTERMPWHFANHPATALVLTNLPYATAPSLRPATPEANAKMIWHDLQLTGTTQNEFRQQLSGLQGFLTENWTATLTEKGLQANKPIVLVVTRLNCPSGLHAVIPQRDKTLNPAYDLIIASQPWRSRGPAEKKAQILAPLARYLSPGGRLVGIQARGGNPGLDIIHRLWPDENPFPVGSNALITATQAALGPEADKYNYHVRPEPLNYRMQAFPDNNASALAAAFHCAIYVAQMPNAQVRSMPEDRCQAVTEEILTANNGELPLSNEVFSLERRL